MLGSPMESRCCTLWTSSRSANPDVFRNEVRARSARPCVSSMVQSMGSARRVFSADFFSKGS